MILNMNKIKSNLFFPCVLISQIHRVGSAAVIISVFGNWFLIYILGNQGLDYDV